MSPPDTYYDALSRLHLLPAKAARPEPLYPRRLVYNRPIIEKGPLQGEFAWSVSHSLTTKSKPPLAPAEWVKCTERLIPNSAARWP